MELKLTVNDKVFKNVEYGFDYEKYTDEIMYVRVKDKKGYIYKAGLVDKNKDNWIILRLLSAGGFNIYKNIGIDNIKEISLVNSDLFLKVLDKMN